MITNWLITGDTHSSLERFEASNLTVRNPENTGIIVLGDFGANYYLNKRDAYFKERVSQLPYTFYLVRGNHEARPQDIPLMETLYDSSVKGEVYWEPRYSNIRYFKDGGFYTINNKTVLTIGGAYSVDKYYRLANKWQWFPNEQLNENERFQIYEHLLTYLKNSSVDFVLTHTAPIKFEPVELFLSCINQEEVDKSMENWLQTIHDVLPDSCCWLFGHYHGDMVMDKNVFMLYNKIVDLSLVEPLNNPDIEMPEGFRLSRQYTLTYTIYT